MKTETDHPNTGKKRDKREENSGNGEYLRQSSKTKEKLGRLGRSPRTDAGNVLCTIVFHRRKKKIYKQSARKAPARKRKQERKEKRKQGKGNKAKNTRERNQGKAKKDKARKQQGTKKIARNKKHRQKEIERSRTQGKTKERDNKQERKDRERKEKQARAERIAKIDFDIAANGIHKVHRSPMTCISIIPRI